MNVEKVIAILQNHVPSAAVPYCVELWNKNPFDFRLRKSRVTKIGDFTFRRGQMPRITVNRDLHSYLFLITYIHEVAHLVVHQTRSRSAHGIEWKNMFQQLLEPLLNEQFFPHDLLKELRRHMIDPMATTFSDPALSKVLRTYDHPAASKTLLSDIPEGSVFEIRGRWFKKGIKRRTRVLCQELNSRKKYLVPIDAPIGNAQLSFL
jgi:SprT protein